MKRFLLALSCALALTGSLFAQATSHPGLFRYRLDNGLELFVYRDATLPLARVGMSFRAGSSFQAADSAGSFGLLERLAFENGGQAGGPEGASPRLKAAMARIGAAESGGGTGTDSMGYWLRLPAARTGEALRFWAERFVDAPLDPAALAAAKAGALARLAELKAEPDAVYEAAVAKRLFGKYPWRRDPAGSEAAIAAATPESLARLRDAYLVPGNAAVFVGGDVDPEETRRAVEALFGGWKRADEASRPALPAHPRPGVPRPTWIVYPDASLPEGLAMVEARYRGPDLQSDPQGSYAADLWTALVADPEGRFKKAVAKEVPKLYGRDSISAYYLSQRDGGALSVSAYFSVDPALSSVDRARQFKERVRGFEMTAMRTEPAYFSAADYEAARRRLSDARALSLETADGFLESLAFWWASASADYFLGYPEALAKTGPREVGAFIDAYVMRNLEVVALRMSPADYEREKKSFAGAGFEVVTAANAFWWQR